MKKKSKLFCGLGLLLCLASCSNVPNEHEINEYKITYYLNNGTQNANNPSTYKNNCSITLEEPTRDEYVFLGWYSNDIKVDSITPDMSGDIELTARWEYHTHEYEKDENGNDIVIRVTPAKCEEKGVSKKHCVICNKDIRFYDPELGHTFAQENGKDKVDWSTKPTCDRQGIGSKKCLNCGKKFDILENPYGHNFKLVENEITKDKRIKIYKCDNDGCGIVCLGLTPSDATEESKKTLKFNEDGGACFNGNTVGNNIETNTYDKNQVGDFFEFEFELTVTEAAYLKECYMYCDVKPADQMAENQLKIFNFSKTSIEPFRGMYIDNLPGHEPILQSDDTYKGVFVENYRYLLYIDDEYIPSNSYNWSADSSLVAEGNLRKDYCFPYNFSFHPGVNKIKLVSATGYNSTFYNFIFVKNTVYNDNSFAGQKLENSDLITDVYRYQGGIKGYYLDACDCTGQNVIDYSNKNTRLGENGINADTWNINGITPGVYHVYINAAYSKNDSFSYWSGAQNVELMNELESNNGTPYNPGARYSIKVDDFDEADLETAKTYIDSGLNEESSNNWTNVPLAYIAIPQGAKSFTITNNNNGHSLWISGIYLDRVAYIGFSDTPQALNFTNSVERVEFESYQNQYQHLDYGNDNDSSYLIVNSLNICPYFSFVTNETRKVKLTFKYKLLDDNYEGCDLTKINIDNFAINPLTFTLKTNSTNINEWITLESEPFALRKGYHEITFNNLSKNNAFWDYFELIEIAE